MHNTERTPTPFASAVRYDSTQNASLGSSVIKERYTRWAMGLPESVLAPGSSSDVPVIVAVGGGKGGVGKSFVSANLGARLAQAGYRVLVVDMDLGCSNLHTHFGVGLPSKTLADYVLHQSAGFSELILSTSIPGLFFCAGGREEVWMSTLAKDRTVLVPVMQELLTARRSYQVDFVVIDLGAGTHTHTMDFFSLAHMGVLTVLPEPTSIENAYVFVRSFLTTLITAVSTRLELEEFDADELKSMLNSVAPNSALKSYADALRAASQKFPVVVDYLLQTMNARTLGLVLNQVRSQNDVDIGTAMEHICRSYFGFDTCFLGGLNYEEAVWRSLRNRKLLVRDFPHCNAVRRLDQSIQKLFVKLALRKDTAYGNNIP